jgi:signal transduction histidine kinase/CheY-like chemotaxis protein/L-asparagine transporter-like permease
MGGSNQSLFLLSALLVGQGGILGQSTAALGLLVVGLLVSYLALPGWTELVLMYPAKVGGIAAVCTEAFKRYGGMPSTLVGVCYWWGWIPTCGLTALLSATAIQQWFLPAVPVAMIACVLVIIFTAVNLAGIENTARLSIPIAFGSAGLAFVAALAPVIGGKVDWHKSLDLHLAVPFPGWFGQVTALMAGLYLIGFAAPAFEAAACHVGETKDPARNVPRAMKAAAGTASLFFVVLPFIWLGTIGDQSLSGDLGKVLGPVFAPILGSSAKAAAVGFMMLNMFQGTMQPLAGASRTLWQLAEDGLLPKFLARLSVRQVPIAATVITALVSISFLLVGDPIWLVAAANFTYLIGISAPSVAVWLLRRNAPEAPRLYRAPRFTVSLGLVAAATWTVSTVLGFEQFGLPTIIAGLAMAYSGAALYAWRKWQDRRTAGRRGITLDLHVKLTGAMLFVLVLDGAGYMLAVSQLPVRTAMSSALADIFVAVALLTMVVGVVLPGTISQTAKNVGLAAEQLAKTTLLDLARGIRLLGEGDLGPAHVRVEATPLTIHSQDELGHISESFNTIRTYALIAVVGLENARHRLAVSHLGLTDANQLLEAKVSEEKKLIEQLRLAKEVAILASASKDRFMARMSHELRTPLHGILASSELLEGAALEEEARHLTHLIHESGTGLLTVIDHILEVTAVESDEATFYANTFNALDMFGELCRRYQRKADWKRIGYSTALDGFDARLVCADREKVYRIADTLLSNAVRFTEHGAVSFRATLHHVRDEVWRLDLAVSDSGQGFNLAEAEEVFTSFMQSEQDADRLNDGAGIGIFLVRELVKKLNGITTFESAPQKGTQIHVSVPVTTKLSEPIAYDSTNQKQLKAASQVVPARETVLNRGSFHILLAEDNPVNQAVAMASLKRLGLTAQIAVDGQDAIAKFESAPFDMVLMDCHMPFVDGIVATQSIRNIEKDRGLAPVPIVGVTADMTSTNLTRCRTAGMNYVLGKPFTFSEFEACIAEFRPLISDESHHSEAKKPTAMPTASREGAFTDASDQAFDANCMVALEALVDEDNPRFVHELIETYLENAAQQVQEIQDALSTGKFAKAGNIAHSLKSSSAYLGAKGFSDLMRSLEQNARADRGTELAFYSHRISGAYDAVQNHLRNILASNDLQPAGDETLVEKANNGTR